MPVIKVKNMQGAEVEELTLNEEIFGIEPNKAVMHEVVVNYLAGLRKGTHSTKSRGEVRGGLLEMSNCDFKANITYYQQAKMQLDVANKIISTNKSLLQEVLQLISS